MFRFDSRSGLISLPAAKFDNGVIRFVLDSADVRSDQFRWRRRGDYYVASSPPCEFIVHLHKGVLAVGIRNTGRIAVTLREIVIAFDPQRLSSPPASEDYREFIHSSSTMDACGVKKIGAATATLPHNPESSMVYLWQQRRTSQAQMLSTLPPHAGDYVCFKALHDRPHLEGHFGIQIRIEVAAQVKPGKTFLSSRLQHRSGQDPVALLQALGRQWKLTPTHRPKPAIQGWNSWDYHVAAIDAASVQTNARILPHFMPGEPRYVVVDDGWQCQWGRWVANDKFSAGLKDICAQVRSTGARPGIWTAPLLAHTFTRLFCDHPEWFARDRDGQIVTDNFADGRMAFVDPTHPEAAQWLEEQFVRLRREGFEYFKVDFTFDVLKCRRFHDPTVPRGAVIRRLFEIVRRAIGPEAYLLACGATYESVTGLADACRVSRDIRTQWSHLVFNAGQIAARWWMQPHLYNVDPDFLLVRCAETSPTSRLNPEQASTPMTPGAWASGRDMNLREVKVHALLVLLAGGEIVLSDELPALNATARHLIRAVLDNRLSRPAIPLDLFHKNGQLPRLWLAREKQFDLLGLFNWSEDDQPLDLNLSELGIGKGPLKPLWPGVPFRSRGGKLSAVLPARYCLALRHSR
jgi:hypothetical protein